MRLLLVGLLCVAGFTCRASDWSLEIVPTHMSDQGARISPDVLTPEFHVILTNLSAHPWKIWMEWNSWGWFNLTFDVTRADGSTFHLEKEDRGWSWNGPDTFLVLPHHSYVWSVRLEKDWKGFPPNWGPMGDNTPVKMTAIFSEHRDPEFEKDSLPPAEEERLVLSEKSLSKKLEAEPYNREVNREVMSINQRLWKARVQENLWIGEVHSDPLTVILQKPQTY